MITKHAVGLSQRAGTGLLIEVDAQQWMPSVYAAMFSARVAQPCCYDATELPT